MKHPHLAFSRRSMLKTLSSGFGYAAFAGLLGQAAAAEPTVGEFASPLAPKQPHFTPKAKRVIMLTMQGAPAHVDLIDRKPRLTADDGKPAYGNRKWLGSPWKFAQHGESGLWISELLPNLAKQADQLCLLNGMYCAVPAHPEAYIALHTGDFRFVRPSVGSWVLYGLGTENQDLPGFVAINPSARFGGPQNYGAAFLPTSYQGTSVDANAGGRPVMGNVGTQLPAAVQRRQLDLVQDMNRRLRQRGDDDERLEGLIQSYELAFRMQGAVPDVVDLGGESAETLAAYGVGEKATDYFGRQCLLARRLAERGVRFIECHHNGWDQHNNLRKKLADNCQQVDQPIAALLADLRQRGMLDETLVIWGGEFGRTPAATKNDGRDHNHKGFSMFMAGGGVRGGHVHGATDEHGVEAVAGRLHTHDLHATMLHLLGLDHERLTYNYAGRDFRLTDVYGTVAKEIIA